MGIHGRIFPVDTNIRGSVIEDSVKFAITDIRKIHLNEKTRPLRDVGSRQLSVGSKSKNIAYAKVCWSFLFLTDNCQLQTANFCYWPHIRIRDNESTGRSRSFSDSQKTLKEFFPQMNADEHRYLPIRLTMVQVINH